MKNVYMSRIIAVLIAAALSLAVFSGCSARNSKGTASETATEKTAPASEPAGEANTVEEQIESDLDRAGSELAEDFGIDSEEEPFDEERYNDISIPESIPAMNADFAEIALLNGEKDTGFPGGPVDELNRPSGPVGYQKKYEKYGAHFIVPDSEKIYLTFDEGYENGYTSRILDILKEKDVKAVFFITYPYAKTEPALVKRMIDEGHTIGNHSTKHFIYPDMPLEEAAQDLMELHEYVLSNYGYQMWLFRPPEGAFSEQTLALTQQLGYDHMLWSFAYKDYDVNAQPIAIEAQGNILKRLHPGEICLLHAVSRTNAEILGETIDEVRKKGFEFADYFYFH